jgi:hypothetical protein
MKHILQTRLHTLNLVMFIIIIVLIFLIFKLSSNYNEYFDFRIYSGKQSRSKPSSSSQTQPIQQAKPVINAPVISERKNGERKNGGRRNGRKRDKIIINNKINNRIRDPFYSDNFNNFDNYITYGTYPYPLVNYPYDYNYRDYYSSNINPYNLSVNGNIVSYFNPGYEPIYPDWCWSFVGYKDANLVPFAQRNQWIKWAKKYKIDKILFPRDRSDFILIPSTGGNCYIDKFGDYSMFEEYWIN